MNAKKVYPLFFLVFPLVLYTVFFILPSFIGLALSFTNWNSMGTEIKFVGLEHFKAIFTETRNLKIIGNTFVFAFFTTIFKNVFGLALALMLNRAFRGRNMLRTIYFLPVVLAPLIIGLVFKSLYNVDTGMINEALRAIGLGTLAADWLGGTSTALGAVILVEVWRMAGQNMVIYVAGLQSISPDYLEAADIDGAGPVKKFLHVTLPQLMPSIRINLILNLIAGLKAFDLILVMTKGGPAGATNVMNTAVYNAYSTGRYGFSTAMGMVMFIITTAIAFVVLRAMSRGEDA